MLSIFLLTLLVLNLNRAVIVIAYPVYSVVPQAVLLKATVIVTVLEQLVTALCPSMIERNKCKDTEHCTMA
jgi:hypothetical protein